MHDAEELVRRAYAAFNARDVEGVLATLAPDVDWPNAWEGGRLVGHDALREYWSRQWAAIDPRVEPLGFTTQPDGGVAVRVRQVVRDLAGTIVAEGEVVHVFTLADGRVARMDVFAAA